MMEPTLYGDTAPGDFLILDVNSTSFLYKIAKWGKFLAIVGFVGIGLMVLLALFAGAAFGAAFSQVSDNSFVGGGFFTVLYLLFAVLYFFPVLYLYRFSVNMRAGLDNNQQHRVNESFKNLKSLFKFMGVLTIFFLAVYALALVGGAIGAAAAFA